MSRKLRNRYYEAGDDEDFGEELELLKPAEEETKGRVSSGDDDDSDGEDQDLYSGDSDDDSAPEDISFSTGKKSAMDRIRDAMKQIDSDKTKLKQKRRKRNDLFEKQKKLKLESLEDARLPDDFLAELSETQPPPVTIPAVVTHSKKDKDDAALGSDNDSAGEGSLNADDYGAESDEDFMPFLKETHGNIRPVCLREEMHKPKSSAVAAAEFRQRALYKNNGTRQTAKKKRSMDEKRRVCLEDKRRKMAT